MGGALARNQPLCRMVAKTAEELGIKTFVETGTNQGITAVWAAALFGTVYTIEADIDKAVATQETFKKHANIRGFYGDAGSMLPKILNGAGNKKGRRQLPGIDEPALFWLDAHNATDRPPIRETLAAVLAHRNDHIIYIDDAQYYWLQCYVDWPTMDELREMLDGHALALVADAMIAYPVEHGAFLKKIALAERRSTYISGSPIWG